MDAAAFAGWRTGVGLLDRPQRSLLLQDLALAEAADPIDHPVAESGAIPMECVAATASAVVGKMADSAPGQDLMVQIGQARIARPGCPHCGGDDIRPQGHASGKPRYRCISCGKSFNPLTGTPPAFALVHPAGSSNPCGHFIQREVSPSLSSGTAWPWWH